MKQLRYILEAALLSLLLALFKILSPRTASNIGGAIGAFLGPKLAASRKAQRNLLRAFPDMDVATQKNVIKAMWENLGRVIAEYPHLKTIGQHHITIEGEEHLKAALDHPYGAIIFGAHIGNWEICATALKAFYDKPISITYRPPNNPYVDRMLSTMRAIDEGVDALPKSSAGGKAMMKALKNGQTLGILIDQKYNEGLSVPFFGFEAMTNPFFVQMAQKYKCPLVAMRGERLDGCNFRITVYEPLNVFNADGTPRAVEDVIKEAHALLEDWIKQRPEQWLWLHRRWKD